MENKVPDERRLSEEERRRNLEALLAGEAIEEYFDAPPIIERVTEQGEIERFEVSHSQGSRAGSSPNHWRLPLILLGLFIAISLIAGVLTSDNNHEETIDSPRGGVGSLDSPRE